jgi:biopolymer transport protein ExbD
MNTNEAFIPSPKKARLEIIPLIDVIFFLLATFVLFTLSLNKLRSLEVNLPVGGHPSDSDQTLFLQATDGGAFFWKIGSTATPELISSAELAPRLADYGRRVATPRVFIRGDNQAKFGSTVFALDHVRLAGIAQVSVETVVSHSGK